MWIGYVKKNVYSANFSASYCMLRVVYLQFIGIFKKSFFTL